MLDLKRTAGVEFMTACCIHTGVRKLVAPLDRSALPGNGADHHSSGPPSSCYARAPYTLVSIELLLAMISVAAAVARPHRHHRHTAATAAPLPHYAFSYLNPPLHPHRRLHRASASIDHQVGVLLPMLLASSHCANLFTESCNSLIGESFAICATFMQRLRQF